MSLLGSRQQAGASTSGTVSGAQLLRCRGVRFASVQGRSNKLVLYASSGSSRSTDTFARDAEKAFQKAKGRWDSFAKEQRLEERANDALKKAGASARDVADKAKDKARRVFVQLDSEYELSAKTAKAARRAEEVARDLDQTYGIRRRARSTRDYVVRMWPTWQKQLDEFTGTWYGKTAVFAGICLLVSTPLFWSILNVLLLLWWLSVPLSLFLLDYARKQQAERLQQQAEEAERARRAAANPFAEMFRGAWGGATGASGASGRGAGEYGPSRSRYTQQDGPIIEAEWTSIDEGDSAAGKRGR